MVRMQWFSWRTCTVRAAGANVECRKNELLGGSGGMPPGKLIKISQNYIMVPNRQSHSMRLHIEQGGCLSRPRYAKKKCLVKFYKEN